MRQFDELLEVASILNGPDGCPWDRRQTFSSLQPFVLEEAHEVVDAVDRGNPQEIIEELGDLLYTVLFYAKVAQKEGLFSIEEILETVKSKLVRRHPHVFNGLKVDSEEDVVRNWELIKKEKEGKMKSGALEGVPIQLPALAKAQKMLKIFGRLGFVNLDSTPEIEESEVASSLFEIVQRAEKSNIDSEGALRKLLAERKSLFEQWESLAK